jgi:hypothetical protein
MDKMVSLHKYYMWATYMAAQFQKEASKPKRSMKWGHPDALQPFMFMSYWYATLFVVAEGWQELRLTDPAVDQLLTDPHLALLKRYRHGVFHFQPDYFDKRYSDFMDQGRAAITWVNQLHGAFTAYFTRWMDTHNLDGTPKLTT